MSEEWNGMNESQKTSFNATAKLDKERYEREKKDYEKTKGTAQAAAGKSSTSKQPVGGKSSTKKEKVVAEKEDESEHSDDDE